MVSVRDRCTYWQHVLGLNHWRIECLPFDEGSSDGDENLGLTEFFPEAGLAVIRIHDDAPNWVLVHELLHVLLHPLRGITDRNADWGQAEHHVVHALVKALMQESHE